MPHETLHRAYLLLYLNPSLLIKLVIKANCVDPLTLTFTLFYSEGWDVLYIKIEPPS